MKRTTIVALILGVVVSAIVIALHASRFLLAPEEAVMRLVLGQQAPPKIISIKTQYLLVVLLSLGACWLGLTSQRRLRLIVPVVLFAAEIFLISWICLLFQVFFQPLPSALAVLLGFGAALAFAAFTGRSRSGMARELFYGRISDERLSRIASGDLPYDAEAKSYSATAVVCDIANKHDLADECSPAQMAEITDRFIQRATESFVKAGAYIETITGEGIVAVFGFPGEDAEQAEKATRHALTLLSAFDKMRENGSGGASDQFSIHLGISSGTMIFAPLQQDNRRSLLATGEPVELARRFCIANRFYGSRVLIGPGTFELASKNIVARPIDFLSGVDVRERHEIYEPLMLSGEASPEQISRRDAFWNGVVLYREKRWAEAYAQFQKARGPDDEDDAPLQLYLRRLEPLALHLVDAP
ncbi:MAG: adenylate/guanylate cyclase domain-containing protein [Verrucomicrobiota bacterium]|nr:adenylate/guanylate cyclase domain-containing protein [Verrucomicrobiota bacterium]